MKIPNVPDCRACELWAGVQTVGIMGEGESGGILFVAIGPGRDEDAEGKVFVGNSGRKIRFITEMYAKDTPVAFVNLVGCRPPDDDPTPTQIEACWSKHGCNAIGIFRPRVLVALGGKAAAKLTGWQQSKQKSFSVERNRMRPFTYEGLPVVITFHPAAILRGGKTKGMAYQRALIEDIQRAVQICNGKTFDSFVPTRLEHLPDSTNWVLDTETTSLRPWSGRLLRVGVAALEKPQEAWIAMESPK